MVKSKKKGKNKMVDKDEFIKRMFKLMMESLMEGERTALLGYDKHDFSGYGSPNSRNGYYQRDLLTGLGNLEKLNIPRDRMGDFSSELLDKWESSTKPMDNLILSLYAKGMTTRDINDVVEKIYGKSYSPASVSLITKEIEEERLAWEKRPLEKRYIAIFIDALFVKTRRGETVSSDAVYTACGINEQGHRDILGIYAGAEESATFWKEALSDLKERGVQQILLFVFDGLTGLEEVVHQVFPKSLTQLCLVHQIRNTLSWVRPNDKQPVAQDLKTVYKSKSLSEAKEKILLLKTKWQLKYPKLFNRWIDKIDSLMRFLEFPEYLRSHLYSTNWIERLNKEFRKVLKNKNSLPTEDAVKNLIYFKIRDITGKYGNQTLNGFGAYQVDLQILWEKYFPGNNERKEGFTQTA